MDNRVAKSNNQFIENNFSQYLLTLFVKVQRTDGSTSIGFIFIKIIRCILVRCVLMVYENKYPVRILSNLLTNKFVNKIK